MLHIAQQVFKAKCNPVFEFVIDSSKDWLNTLLKVCTSNLITFAEQYDF